MHYPHSTSAHRLAGTSSIARIRQHPAGCRQGVPPCCARRLTTHDSRPQAQAPVLSCCKKQLAS